MRRSKVVRAGRETRHSLCGLTSVLLQLQNKQKESVQLRTSLQSFGIEFAEIIRRVLSS